MFQFTSEFRQEPSTLSPPKPDNNHNNPNDYAPPVSASTLQQLTSIAQEFDELANTCLLLLHLEVRVQCFHYLLTQTHYNKETHEPDPKVLELSRVLANVDEAMTSSLHPRKCKVRKINLYLKHHVIIRGSKEEPCGTPIISFVILVYFRGTWPFDCENFN